MSRAFFLSILLHTLVIAAIFSLFKEKNLYPNSHIKKISLNSIKIEKAKSEKKEPIKKENQTPQKNIKKETAKQEIKKDEPVKKEPHVKRKAKAKNKKLKAKSQEPRAKKLKSKAKYIKRKAKASNNKSYRKAKRTNIKSLAGSNKLQTTNNQSLITNYKSLIYHAINEAKVYPRLAKKMGLQGSVYTCFTVSPGGNVGNITTSGAHAILQRGARQTIDRAKSSFPAVPSVMNICVSINYILE